MSALDLGNQDRDFPEEQATAQNLSEQTQGQPSGNSLEDKFSKGQVVKLFTQSRYGFVKDRIGRDLYFNFDTVRFIGSKGQSFLKEGVCVGYDVGWTSQGLHVLKLKIY